MGSIGKALVLRLRKVEERSAGSGVHGEEIPGGGSCWKPKDVKEAWGGGRGAQDHKGL